MFGEVDWVGMFAVDTPLLEIFIRGTVVYLALFLMLRFVNRRQAGGLGMTDLLVIVLIADAAQNAMAGEYNSITDGVFLVAVIFFWDYVIDMLSYHVPWLDRQLGQEPVPLIRHGKVLQVNLRRMLLTRDELDAQLRLQGVDTLATVKRACMEADGNISVVLARGRTRAMQHKRKKHMGAD